jgi:hypothetical protein
MSAFSCTGAQLAAGAIANLAAGAYTLEYKLLSPTVDPSSPNFQGWPVDPGLTATFVDMCGATQTVTLKTAQYRVPFTTGAPPSPGSTFAVTLTSPNPGNIAEVTIGFATTSGDAPVIPHT